MDPKDELIAQLRSQLREAENDLEEFYTDHFKVVEERDNLRSKVNKLSLERDNAKRSWGKLAERFETQREELDMVLAANIRLASTVEDTQAWVRDLQSGMYVNCVYCGHQYGPSETTVASQALTAHVEQCPKHPMSAIKIERDRLREAMQRVQIIAHDYRLYDLESVATVALTTNGIDPHFKET